MVLLRTRDFVKYMVDAEDKEFIRNPQYLQSTFSNFNFGKLIRNAFNDFANKQVDRGRIDNKATYTI